MAYVIVDSEGATLDSFESALEARRNLRGYLDAGPDVGVLEDLVLLEYRDGRRTGQPIEAIEFLAADPSNLHAFAASVEPSDDPLLVSNDSVDDPVSAPPNDSAHEFQLTVTGRIEKQISRSALRPVRRSRHALSFC
jgi:hypothetical protein